MKKNTLQTKKLVLTGIFLLVFIIGTILIFTIPLSVKATYGLTAQTDDGVSISFNIFEPVGRESSEKKAILIGHGSMVNKEILKGYALELAAAGFMAVPFDFRGHGQSTTGLSDYVSMTKDIAAVKRYLQTQRTDIADDFGYIGYSMGGLGQQLIHTDLNFTCFVGIGTALYPDLRTGNSTNPLDVLMIQALFDEAFTVEEQRQSISNRTSVPIADIDLNKMYGSFNDGNASMVYLDDNTNHLLLAWDEDFIREARDWMINSFNIDVADENFYVNIRGIILLIQVIGGVGFFFSIVEPLSIVILKSKSERKTNKEIQYLTFEIQDVSVGKLTSIAIVSSIFLGIPGLLIFLLPLMWILPSAIAGFVSALLFGAAFGILIVLWRTGKKSNISLWEMIKKTFNGRDIVLKHVLLGTILAAILFIIAYLSIGLNYLGLVPSIIKILSIFIYVPIWFCIFIIFYLFIQGIFQNKYNNDFKGLLKIGFLGFIGPFIYMFTYLFAFGVVGGVIGMTHPFFYFGTFIPIALIMFPLTSFVSAICYKKSGNIIAGAIVNSFLLTMLVVTMSNPGSIVEFLLRFIS